MARLQLAGLALIAVVFAVALSYASVELPLLVSARLADAFHVPGYDSGQQFEHAESFVTAHRLRPVGAAALAAVVLMMVVGLASERRGWAAAGAVGFFLPVFGHFAASMFFLAGLGLLRVVWLPVLDVSYTAMSLGDVVFTPYAAAVWLAAVAGLDIRDLLAWLAMGGGILIFSAGMLAWFVARARGDHLADLWAYRLCRHPQYLGWMLWSYGLLLYVARHSELYHFKISWGLGSSLPWLVAAAVIVGVAMLEEVRMRRDLGTAYESYRKRAPFLVPLPKRLAEIVVAPMRWLLAKDGPETGGDVVRVIGLYLAIAVVLSLPGVLLGWPAPTGWWAFPYNVWPFR